MSGVRKERQIGEVGDWKFKDHLGNITLATALATLFVDNAPITDADSPYLAVMQETVKCQPSAGAITVELPTPTAPAGQHVQVVVDNDDNPPPFNVTVVGEADELINGQASFVMNTKRESAVLEHGGSAWIII